ncbi:transglutaminase domain-containing protein [Paenibacillus beijingensis]|uniref:transglutaminase domain-containing protein n=1 Tax=Paenibacillus beijingensis TaxID=1126833 RepID=UPI00069750B5|nr:transglutaminase domain-containing protein [Paenibacillus beijingensis]
MRAIAKLMLTALFLVTGVALNIRLETTVKADLETSANAGLTTNANAKVESADKAEQVVPAGIARLEREFARQFAGRSASFTSIFEGDPSRLNKSIASVIGRALHLDDYTAYIIDSYTYTVRSRGSLSSIQLQVRYRETQDQTAEVDREVKKALGQILQPDMNADEKVKFVHDWVVRRLAYDESLQRYTAYEALRYGKAVCQGYALLTYKMLSAAGIPVRIVEGKVASGDHAWNLVLLGGRWYHMDTTWDDPLPDRPGRVRYDYYLKTDEQMREDHSWTRPYPEAVTEYDGRH